MKGLSITGLVLGAAGPLVLLAPLILALFGDDSFWQVGWAFLFFTIPLGLALEIAGGVLVIVADSLALRRRYEPKAMPIVAISLVGAGLVVQLAAGIGAISVGEGWTWLAFGAGLALTLTGVIMGAVVGIRARHLRWRRR